MIQNLIEAYDITDPRWDHILPALSVEDLRVLHEYVALGLIASQEVRRSGAPEAAYMLKIEHLIQTAS